MRSARQSRKLVMRYLNVAGIKRIEKNIGWLKRNKTGRK